MYLPALQHGICGSWRGLYRHSITRRRSGILDFDWYVRMWCFKIDDAIQFVFVLFRVSIYDFPIGIGTVLMKLFKPWFSCHRPCVNRIKRIEIAISARIFWNLFCCLSPSLPDHIMYLWGEKSFDNPASTAANIKRLICFRNSLAAFDHLCRPKYSISFDIQIVFPIEVVHFVFCLRKNESVSTWRFRVHLR